MKNWLRKKFRRKQWTANRADPTVVIQWRSKYLTMVGSWGVEANVYIWGFKFRFYDNRFFNWFWGWLEDIYNSEQSGYEDRVGDYI